MKILLKMDFQMKVRFASYKRSSPPEISEEGSVAEWSKALALGASPKGRGFEPHHYHLFCFQIKIHSID